MRRTAPLFQLDAGWLFVLAGLAVCAAGVILPAQSDLRTLQKQLDTLRTEESRAYARLKAYNDFLEELDEEDPALVRRLAASQLNIVPASDRPVLLSTAQIAPVTNWIEATVAYDPPVEARVPESTLSRLANGPLRLWLFAGGIMCVFVGLLMGSAGTRRNSVAVDADSSDSRLNLGEFKVDAPDVDDSMSETALANELATTREALSVAAIAELAHDIAGEVKTIEEDEEEVDTLDAADEEAEAVDDLDAEVEEASEVAASEALDSELDESNAGRDSSDSR